MLDRLKEDMKSAMRAKEKARLTVIRSIQAELKNAGIEKKGNEGLTEEVESPAHYLSEGEQLAVLRSMVKKRRDSAEQYEQGGREDLRDIELSEIEVIEQYLPQPLSTEEIEALIQEAIAEVGASSMADMGKVMKAAQPKAAGRADGKILSDTVRRLLG
ncbi:MAG: glutamyl-tRNA amidotransferase [Planctomycetes bacterium]|nr:glutamyl-tRNA amidotransferase [Planctomycetota bacterium]